MFSNYLLTEGVRGFPGGVVVKNSLADAGSTRNVGSVPELGRSPGGGNGNPRIIAWRIPWAKEPGGLQSIGLQKVRHD